MARLIGKKIERYFRCFSRAQLFTLNMSDQEKLPKIDAKTEEKIAESPKDTKELESTTKTEATSENSDKKRPNDEKLKKKKKRRTQYNDEVPPEKSDDEKKDDDKSDDESGEEEAFDDEEDDLAEIDTTNIITSGRRTRGKVIDFNKASEKLAAEGIEEEDDDNEFESK